MLQKQQINGENIPLSRELQTAIKIGDITQITPGALGEDQEGWNDAINYAAMGGKVEILRKLLREMPNPEGWWEVDRANGYLAFRKAIKNEQFKVAARLLQKTPNPEERREMVRANGDSAFCEAIENKELDFAARLLALMPDKEERQAMVHSLSNRVLARNPRIVTFLNILEDGLFASNSEFNRADDQKVIKLRELRASLIKGFEELYPQDATPNDAATPGEAATLVIGGLLTGNNLLEQVKSVEASAQLSRGQNKLGLPEDVIGHVGGFLQPRISGLLSPEQKEVAQKVMEGFFSQGFPKLKKPEQTFSSQSLKMDDGQTKTTEQKKFWEDRKEMNSERIKREAEKKESQGERGKEPQEKKPEEKKGDSRDHKEEELNQRPEVIRKGEVAESKTPSAIASSDKSGSKTPLAESEQKPLTEREKTTAARVEYYKNNQTTPPSSKESDQKPSSEIEPASSKQVQGTEQKKGGAMWERR